MHSTTTSPAFISVSISKLLWKLWQKHLFLEGPWSRWWRKGIIKGSWGMTGCGAGGTAQNKEQWGKMAVSAQAARPSRVNEIARNEVLKGANLDINQSRKQWMSLWIAIIKKKNPVIKPPLTSSWILYIQNYLCFKFLCSCLNSFLLHSKRGFVVIKST